jgi:hypothetical protein
MIVAATALALALGGTAIAAPGLTASKITRSKVKSIADQRIEQAAPGLSVATAGRADKATSADTATSASTATTAASAGTATNAEALNGLRANQLGRATTKTGSPDAFDEATFTDVLSKSVTAPTAGIFVISAQMNVNRSNSGPEATLVAGRAALDGAAATVQTHQRATEDGTFGEAIAVTGAVAVTPGTHTVSLQAAELSDGAAFLSQLALTVQFVPFGDAGQAGVLSTSGGRSANE